MQIRQSLLFGSFFAGVIVQKRTRIMETRNGKLENLNRFAHNLIDKAREGKLDPEWEKRLS